ncbi:5665_t:CDS:2 [Gigaspora rosea]|nr:5665_t:CDS:2 [Gigaspora rosea]
MSKLNPNHFTLVTSAIKLGSNNKLLQKSLELDMHRNDPEEGEVEEFLRLFYDDFVKILVKEDKLVIDLVRSRYLWFGLGGQGAEEIESNNLIEALENLHTREVVTLEKQKEFIRYLTRSSENGSPIAPMVLGYAYHEGKFGFGKDLDKGKKYLECASERGNEKATEMLSPPTSKRNAYIYDIIKEE